VIITYNNKENKKIFCPKSSIKWAVYGPIKRTTTNSVLKFSYKKAVYGRIKS
jgi:hypothetical protein